MCYFFVDIGKQKRLHLDFVLGSIWDQIRPTLPAQVKDPWPSVKPLQIPREKMFSLGPKYLSTCSVPIEQSSETSNVYETTQINKVRV